MKFSIRNGHLVDPANRVDGVRDLYVADGYVVGVGKAPDGSMFGTAQWEMPEG